MGVSPMTGPSPNRGYEAAALQRLGVVLQQMTQIVSMAGATSDVGRAVLEAMNKLTKLVPSGSVTPAAQRNSLEATARSNAQNNQQATMLREMLAKQQGGAQQKPAQPAPQAMQAA